MHLIFNACVFFNASTCLFKQRCALNVHDQENGRFMLGPLDMIELLRNDYVNQKTSN